jgi:hypothetical protein
MMFCNFFVHDIWGGTREDIFWARTDDDLIAEMLAKAVAHFSV